ncbi:aminotransferase class I/II-fold pyridoxal phosphate-dependent enzyme [Occultella glacieicola]|uniref:cysteine-S-conjugate beta-lyase n=1 Tax=Occultella glacieicola TaxID=2518684 RepID=A0ABY2E350_9MICO|nr:aminotransferase class I/II-fold pyridoxal phosphate-dependent enzyme [Occultella glacieicola]TDE92629.1 aminotransferase class I/II-fold pyridoxal phosphate-dependent enzyme [Occultella glacieicola]
MDSAVGFDSSGFDDLTIESLRGSGSVKWSTFPDRIGAFVAEMDFGTAPAVSAALHEAVDRGVFGYLPGAVLTPMQEACAAWSRTVYGWDVPAANVRPLPDVISALQAAIEHFCTPGSPVILPTPAYMPFLTVPPAMGREIIQVPMLREAGRDVYDLDGLDAAFRAGGNLLILCNPHNPIGRVLERDEMEAIAAVVERHGGRVFSDEIHAPLVFSGHKHVPYASISDATAGHTVTAASASKAWNLPGLKCAQLILSNDADVATWREVGMMPEHGAANLGVIANTAAYSAGGQWLTDVLRYLEGNRDVLSDLVAEHLPGADCTPAEGTYLAWIDCRALDLGPEPGGFFAEHASVALVDGSACGDAGTGFVRYNFATPRPIMVRALEQMGAALARR